MSKKLNTSGSAASNTLFNYFSKSPAPVKKQLPKAANPDDDNKKDSGKENSKNVKNTNGKRNDVEKKKPEIKEKLNDSMDVDEITQKSPESVEEISFHGRKRRRLIVHESESEDDFKDDGGDDDFNPETTNENTAAEESDDDTNLSAEISKELEEEAASENTDSDAAEIDEKRKKKRNMDDEPSLKRVKLENAKIVEGSSFMEKLKNLQADAEQEKLANKAAKNSDKYELIVDTNSTLDEPVVWPHQKLDFLKPDKIKDNKGRRPDHPDYDASTLEVPKTFLDKLSPGVRQWWVLKTDNFDCVLFFKVGKFYELYHMDADVGVNELGFTYMRGEFAHSGFPEVSFDKMASILVERGYKVARVEQTETPDMMTERCKQIKPTRFDKVVRREICQITNRGTQVFGSQCQVTPNYQPNYMLAIVEKNEDVKSQYGICYIDTTIGDFYIGQFDDDKNCSRLLTLLSHHMPVLILTERSSLSDRTQQIFRTVLAGILKESLPNNGANACTAEKTLKHLAENYITKEDNWPLALRMMQDGNDHLGLTPNSNSKLALKALGECISYIKKCHLEEKILPMARFNIYTPPDALYIKEIDLKIAKENTTQRAHMVLDSTTLSNLRITDEEHSLLATLDNCCTKFGKRLLHHWLCSPSCVLDVIVERQNAITDLLENHSILQAMRALFAPLPDFERHLAQIHLFGNKIVAKNHPDGRAILFEEKIYNKKKIQNFISIIKGFESLITLPYMFNECNSELIKHLTQLSDDGGIFPNMIEIIDFFKYAFDHNEAAKTGVIAPGVGVDADYDAAQKKIKDINQELKEYLIEQERYFGCRLTYFGADKKRFQLEIPESHVRKANNNYALEGQKKGNKPCRRYTTNETRSFLKQMQQAEDERNGVLKDISRRIFEKFSNHYSVWKQCVDCISNLDVLGSLAEYARHQNIICIPELKPITYDMQGFVEIDDGYHPCVSSDTYIPNGIILGADNIAPLSILTGPNMGGKSTLMRQIGLLAIMAQIGAHVPAKSCKMSIVDRIFTRLGAQDDILAGHSTFLVELNETSLILKHATQNSLVLLDELGRGTATYDGTAIAASVVNYLADLKCRTLFSTHYHNLIDYFHKDKRITLGHMACMVENEDTEDPTQETVTFLYKYSSGACPKSYGFNAAKIAGMPHPIIKRAYELSKKVEAIALKRKIAAKILATTGHEMNAATIKNLLSQLKQCHV